MVFFQNVNALLSKEKLLKKLLETAKNKKEEIDAKYYEKAPTYNIKVQTTPKQHDDEIIEAMHEKNELKYKFYDGKFYSLEEYIQVLEEDLKDTKETIEVYKETLNELEGKDSRLYYLIQFKGYTPTKAVEKVADEFNCTEYSIWKKHYKKVKKIIKV